MSENRSMRERVAVGLMGGAFTVCALGGIATAANTNTADKQAQQGNFEQAYHTQKQAGVDELVTMAGILVLGAGAILTASSSQSKAH